jgi:hypothetical protein
MHMTGETASINAVLVDVLRSLRHARCIASMFTVSQTIPREMVVFMREYLTGANRPSTYFLGLSFAEFPYQVG